MDFSNIWKHPRTSIAGVLIAITTIAGVLTQHGITLGSIGTGTVVTLISALATALLGLLANDPTTSASAKVPNPPTTLLLVIFLLLIPAFCTPVEAQTTTTSNAAALSFTAESEASVIHFDDAFLPAVSTNELLKVAAFGSKNQHSLYLVGNEFNVPGSFNAYSGGARFQPDISGFLSSRTVLPSTALQVYLEAFEGNALSSTSNTSNFIQRYGGGIKVSLNSSGSLVAKAFSVHYDRVGAVNTFDASSGLSYLWGGK
jgi:hypothetical protein